MDMMCRMKLYDTRYSKLTTLSYLMDAQLALRPSQVTLQTNDRHLILFMNEDVNEDVNEEPQRSPIQTG